VQPSNGLEVFRRRRRITGFDDVHIQPGQLPGDGEFLAASEAGAGGLLAVPQRGIEYGNFFGHCLNIAHPPSSGRGAAGWRPSRSRKDGQATVIAKMQ
jgi:hypothetical protein